MNKHKVKLPQVVGRGGEANDEPQKNEMNKKIREGLAELEHDQWVAWSRSLAIAEDLSPERLERWGKLWIPYAELTEEQKDQDRIWADKQLTFLDANGLVIWEEKELPPMYFTNRKKMPWITDHDVEFGAQQEMLKYIEDCKERLI